MKYSVHNRKKNQNYLEIYLTRKTQNLNKENIISEHKTSFEQKEKYSYSWVRILMLRSQSSKNDA